MRPRSVTRGDPEPLLARPPPAPLLPEAPPLAGAPTTIPSAHAQPAGTLPVPPPMDATQPLPSVPPPLPPPRAAFSPGAPGSGSPGAPGAGSAPTPEVPLKAPLLPGAKAPGGSASDPLYFSFLGKELPDLAPDGVWLTPGISPSISGLRGQVVYLQFAFQVLSVVRPDHPVPAAVAAVVRSAGPQHHLRQQRADGEQGGRGEGDRRAELLFPYFHDPSGESLRIYGVRAFPTAYVVDRAGKVVWEGTPTANEPRIGEFVPSRCSSRSRRLLGPLARHPEVGGRSARGSAASTPAFGTLASPLAPPRGLGVRGRSACRRPSSSWEPGSRGAPAARRLGGLMQFLRTPE